jgi:hypothetical protein
MKLKIIDSTLDYAKAAKDLQLDVVQTNIQYHQVELHIEDWPIEFTNTVRFILHKLYITTRLMVNITECTDPKIIKELFEHRLNNIVISSECPAQPFKYEAIHAHSFDNPLNITLADSSIGKYINKSVIGVLDKGRRIKIEGEVVKSCALDTGKTNFDFATVAGRNIKEFHEYDVDDLTYNKGIYRFRYEDNVEAKVVMKNVFEIFSNIISDIKSNLDTYLSESVDIPYLTIPRDRSSIIAVCVKHYIYREAPEEIKQIQQAYNKTPDGTGSVIEFRMSNMSEIRKHIEKGLDKLLKDINRFHAS